MARAETVVVIGGSLGGFQALSKLAGLLPPDFPAPILAALHTHPDGPRFLVRIIRTCTSLKAVYGQNNEIVRPGTIYIAPPDRHLVVTARGVIGLSNGPKVRYARPAVDPLFESAAKIYGPDVIGVVLSGGGRDGTDGMLAIREAGGVGIVQLPEDSRDSSMPLSALSSASPDYQSSIEDIAPLLARLVSDGSSSEPPLKNLSRPIG